MCFMLMVRGCIKGVGLFMKAWLVHCIPDGLHHVLTYGNCRVPIDTALIGKCFIEDIMLLYLIDVKRPLKQTAS